MIACQLVGALHEKKKNAAKHPGDVTNFPVLCLLRCGDTGLLLQLLRGQRGALQLHPAAAAESGAQRDTAGDSLHSGTAAPSSTACPHQKQRCADVHVGLV